MPLTKGVVVANAEPPVAAAYHLIPVPVAVKLATVGVGLAQKVCVAAPVGAAGIGFTVIVIFFLHVTPFTVTSHQ